MVGLSTELPRSYNSTYIQPPAFTSMSDQLSPTPSLIEERHEKKRRLLSWIMTQARGIRSGPPIRTKPWSPLSSSTFVPGSPTVLTPSKSESTMHEDYATHVYDSEPLDARVSVPANVLAPEQSYARNLQDSTLYNAYPGPTPYTTVPPRQAPIASTRLSLSPEAAAAPYMSNNRAANNASVTIGVIHSADNNSGVPPVAPNPQSMTTVTVIPGAASSPPAVPVPAPQPAPISSPVAVSHNYANPASPIRELSPMKSAAYHLVKGKLPAVAQNSRQPYPHSGPIHREELDPPTSRSRAARDTSRSPASEYSMPRDYVPVSQASGRSRSRSRHASTRERPLTPPPDRSRARAADATHHGYYSHRESPSTTGYRERPHESHNYSTTPRHHTDNRHKHHYGDNGHKHHHSDHAHNRHRSSSQPAHHTRTHHHRHRDVQPSSSRPTNIRQRSFSVGAGDPRVRMSHGAPSTSHGYEYGTGYSSTAHPQIMPQPQPQTAYPGYTHSQPTAPTNTGFGTMRSADNMGHYRVIVQPPSSAQGVNVHQPVGVPVKDGMGGWSVVPGSGQNVHVVVSLFTFMCTIV